MSNTAEWPTTGSATIRIASTPEDAYDFVTDLDRLPMLSPENVRCEFTGDSTEIIEGATFKGWNRSGNYEWSADCVVQTADRGREFTFVVPPGFDYATTWRYQFERDGDGVVVTESFDSPMLGDPDIYPGKIEGRCEQLRDALSHTLDQLKTALETSSGD